MDEGEREVNWDPEVPDMRDYNPAEYLPDFNFVDQKHIEDSGTPSWWLFDTEPNMDDIKDKAGDSLDYRFKEKLKISFFQDTYDREMLFLARFEFPKYGETFEHPDGVVEKNAVEEPIGFVDFLTGTPLDCNEMLVMVGQHSTDGEELDESGGVMPGTGPTAPFPEEMFVWDPAMTLMVYNHLFQPGVEWMVENLSGEPDPKYHWWVRFNFGGKADQKFPIPGEFFGLGVRLMPDVPWGTQKSSPFVYSGNWMDTVYYTSAVVTEVIEPTDDVPCPTYKVKWRKDEVTVTPSDFAEYKVGDRVTILKDVATEKKSQLWKDDDMETFGATWMIAPIGFYGLDKEDAS